MPERETAGKANIYYLDTGKLRGNASQGGILKSGQSETQRKTGLEEVVEGRRKGER